MLVLLLLAAPLGLDVSAQSGVKLPVLLVVQLPSQPGLPVVFLSYPPLVFRVVRLHTNGGNIFDRLGLDPVDMRKTLLSLLRNLRLVLHIFVLSYPFAAFIVFCAFPGLNARPVLLYTVLSVLLL